MKKSKSTPKNLCNADLGDFIEKSRYGQDRFIRKVDDTKYVVYGQCRYFRCGEKFFDFEGGPIIIVGMEANLIGLNDDRSVVSVKALDCKDEGYAECLVEIG